jgi:hypothetical protein
MATQTVNGTTRTIGEETHGWTYLGIVDRRPLSVRQDGAVFNVYTPEDARLVGLVPPQSLLRGDSTPEEWAAGVIAQISDVTTGNKPGPCYWCDAETDRRVTDGEYKFRYQCVGCLRKAEEWAAKKAAKLAQPSEGHECVRCGKVVYGAHARRNAAYGADGRKTAECWYCQGCAHDLAEESAW